MKLNNNELTCEVIKPLFNSKNILWMDLRNNHQLNCSCLKASTIPVLSSCDFSTTTSVHTSMIITTGSSPSSFTQTRITTTTINISTNYQAIHTSSSSDIDRILSSSFGTFLLVILILVCFKSRKHFKKRNTLRDIEQFTNIQLHDLDDDNDKVVIFNSTSV